MNGNNNLNNLIAYKKIKHFCAYQERCHSEVKYKLISLGVYGDKIDEIIAALIQENFLNESRFANAYARGKHNINFWGKIKIRLKLKEKKVSKYNIKKGMEAIDDEIYLQNLTKILKRRLKRKYDAKTIQKTIKFCLGKGYEYSLITQQINLLKDEKQ